MRFDGICKFQGGHGVTGWARNLADPGVPLGIEVRSENGFQAFVTANLPQTNLAEAQVGGTGSCFRCELPDEILADGVKVHVRVRGSDFELRNSPLVIRKGLTELDSILVSPKNIREVLSSSSRLSVRYLLVDPNDTCNVHCLYCPNKRTNKRIELDEFAALLEKITPPNILQMGCLQELTVDKRLPRFFELIGASKKKPGLLQMITNGTVLDRHDTSVFVANGLNALMLSIDSPDPEVSAKVRIGTDLGKILANVRQFREQFPRVELRFSSVISSETIGQVFDLVRLGQELGVSIIFFKEVTDVLMGAAVAQPAGFLPSARDPRYFEAMPRLLLQPGQFQQMQAEVTARWPSASFRFLSSEFQGHRRSSFNWEASSFSKAARQDAGVGSAPLPVAHAAGPQVGS